MGSRYNDTLGVIWLSDSDLPNQDVWVYFKITPLVVLDSAVSVSRAPVLVDAFGVQRDSVITVLFNEAVDFSSIFDVVNWEVKGLGVKKVKVRNGLITHNITYPNISTYLRRYAT